MSEKVAGLKAAAIVVSDRIVGGERENTVTAVLESELLKVAEEVVLSVVVAEGYDAVFQAINEAKAAGARLIVTAGGTGIGPRNMTPEATAQILETRLEGLESQVLFKGLQSTPQAGLSRGLIGVTGRHPNAAIVANAPSSKGGVKDTMAVLIPVVPNILEGLSRA